MTDWTTLNVIDSLSLSLSLHSLPFIVPQRGVSGGEKRRCSIAAELLNEADIIFLDEPTSGLDAYTAARTMKTLKQFCLISNKMVIATIHQPSVEVFYLFDKLQLLGAGRSCFESAINDVDEYFADKISPTQNPADVIIYEAQREPAQYAERWSNDRALNALSHPAAKRENDQKWGGFGQIDIKMIRKKEVAINDNNDRAAWSIQFWLLMLREVMALYRDYRLSLILQIIFLAAFIGILFFDLGKSESIGDITLKAIFCGLSALTVIIQYMPS